jgi:hypothetical protein
MWHKYNKLYNLFYSIVLRTSVFEGLKEVLSVSAIRKDN